MDILDKIKDIFDEMDLFNFFFEWEEEEEECSPELCSGDIICISRGLYDHYGVYDNEGSVIHFSSKDSDISFNNEIIETDLCAFKRGDSGLRKLVFPKRHKRPRQIPVSTSALMRMPFPPFSFFETYKLYSPSETVQRARSQLGKKDYNIFLNNCEHFAIWCKTGVHESHQINDLLDMILKNPKYIK